MPSSVSSSNTKGSEITGTEANHSSQPQPEEPEPSNTQATSFKTATQKPNLRLFKHLWPFLTPHKGLILGAGLALIFTSSLTLALGQGVRFIIDEGILQSSPETLNQILMVMGGLVAILSIATFIRFYLVTSIGERVIADLRKAVFQHLLHLHPSYFEENRSGEIMSRLTTDTTLLQSIIGSSVSLALRNTLMLMGGLFMLIITNIKLTLVVMISVPIVIIPILYFGRRVRSLSRQSQDSIADVGTYAGEIIQQIKTVQSYNRQNFEKKAFSAHVEKAFNVAQYRIRFRAFLMAVAIFLSFFSIGLMIWIGGNDVIRGVMSGGELAAFVFYAIMVAMSVASVSEVYGELQRGAGAMERLMELLNVTPLISSPSEAMGITRGSRHHIDIESLTFHYPSRPRSPALNNLTLTIETGDTVALVGPSGAGKSTLFELILRFYDPNKGVIRLNSIDIKKLDLQELRSEIALVPQHPTLFSHDVWQNIRYGKPEATDEEVIAAAKAANAHEFIEQLPNQYDSFLGENGVRLSGGQKQRIVIARAILNDPALLLLDEATSALDAQSEHQVQQALQSLMKNRTTLIIAHRLSTVQSADKILVLDHGQLVAEGTHQSLMEQSSLYKRLAELQFHQWETQTDKPKKIEEAPF